MSRKVWIHYGANAFDPELVKTNRLKLFANKPNGLWASPTDRKAWTWKKWCESEEFRLDDFDEYFKFRIARNAKILWIHKLDDAKKYLAKENKCPILTKLDVNKVMRDYDGMVLIHGKNYEELHCNAFNAWDVDSICVWNPDVVEPIRKVR